MTTNEKMDTTEWLLTPDEDSGLAELPRVRKVDNRGEYNAKGRKVKKGRSYQKSVKDRDESGPLPTQIKLTDVEK